MGNLSQKPAETDLVVWTRAKGQLSLYKGTGSTSGDEEELSDFIPTTPRRPPPEGTAQAQMGGVYGNDFLELILIQSGDRLGIRISVLGNFMHM